MNKKKTKHIPKMQNNQKYLNILKKLTKSLSNTPTILKKTPTQTQIINQKYIKALEKKHPKYTKNTPNTSQQKLNTYIKYTQGE